jgi:membrane protease YdiL (CAAX protease family)
VGAAARPASSFPLSPFSYPDLIVAPVLIAIGLIAYNNLLNLWSPFHRWAYVPLNVAASLVIVAAGLTLGELEPSAIGISKPETAFVGAAIGLIASAPLFAALVNDAWADFIADRRFASDSNADTAFRMLVRVPLGTALLEEVAFRGVLLALLAPLGTIAAAVASSVAFGLWHIVPTANAVRANRASSTTGLAVAILGGVIFTTAAGVGLVWLRVESGSLFAPLALHATLNSSATLAATLATRSGGGRGLVS